MIRPAHPDDAEIVRTVVHAAYKPWVPRLGRVPGPMNDDYARRIAADQVWVLEQAGEIVGLVVLEEQPDSLLLGNVAVLPSEQGKGYGPMLIAFAEQEAVRRGFHELQLCTNARWSRTSPFTSISASPSSSASAGRASSGSVWLSRCQMTVLTSRRL